MQRLALVACLVAVCFAGASAQSSYPNFIAALGSSQYSLLNEVVDGLGLKKTFSNPKLAVTVFVPDNNAFNAAVKKTGISMSVLSKQKTLMQQIVYYHIVKAVVKAPLPNKDLVTFVTGQTLKGAGMMVKAKASTAKIIRPNVICGAGVAHGIDTVLMYLNIGKH